MHTVTKTIELDAPAEVVFKTFTSPGDIRMFRGADARLALRKEGHFTHSDPSGDVYESGKFIDVRPREMLRYELEHHGYCRGSIVTVQFDDLGAGRSKVSVSHANLDDGDTAHMQAQWDWELMNLKSYVEEGKVQTFKGWFKTNKKSYPALKG